MFKFASVRSSNDGESEQLYIPIRYLNEMQPLIDSSPFKKSNININQYIIGRIYNNLEATGIFLHM